MTSNIVWTQEMVDRLDREIQEPGISLTLKIATHLGERALSSLVGSEFRTSSEPETRGWIFLGFYLYQGNRRVASGTLATDGKTFHVFNTRHPLDAADALAVILHATQTRDDRPMEMIPEDYYAL